MTFCACRTGLGPMLWGDEIFGDVNAVRADGDADPDAGVVGREDVLTVPVARRTLFHHHLVEFGDRLPDAARRSVIVAVVRDVLSIHRRVPAQLDIPLHGR